MELDGCDGSDKPTAAKRDRLADWLTVERAAYAGIAVLALGVRLYGLGRVAADAGRGGAGAAGAGRGGRAADDLIGISPLLYTLHGCSLRPFGATDAARASGPRCWAGWRRCCSTRCATG